MTTEDNDAPARVIVEFHSSSAKDGREAYKVVVTGNDSTEAEADRVMALALRSRDQALAALRGVPDTLDEQLAKSIGPLAPTAGSGLCERCGGYHPKDWLHDGDCEHCKQRPVMDKPGAVFCAECTEKLRQHIEAIVESMT